MTDIITDANDKFYMLHPAFVDLVKQFLKSCELNKLSVGITAGYRSFEEQNKLFLKRPKVTNAKGGFSWHNYGLAVDVVYRDKKGKFTWDDNLPWDKLGELGKAVGLEWGGDWQFKDRPHFQLTAKINIRSALRLYQQGGLGNVWRELDKLISH